MTEYCFVMQPFNDEYNKKYKDIYKLAIEDANIAPYRVDQDYSVEIPIQAIEEKIKGATICFADISEDNPNVWFEVGYARSQGKKIVYVSKDKEKYPFDIQHQRIIAYRPTSLSDFQQLKKNITETLVSYIKNVQPLVQAESFRSHVDGLGPIEILILKKIIEDPCETCTHYQLVDDFKVLNLEKASVWFAIQNLLRKNFITENYEHDSFGNEPSYKVLNITEQGKAWALSNETAFSAKNIKHSESIFYEEKKGRKSHQELDEEIPF